MFFPIHDHNPIRHIIRPWVTWALIAVNVAIFLVQSSTPGNAQATLLLSFGMVPAVIGDAVIDPFPGLPSWATLVTYAFLHGDIWHLATNMLFLFVFGDNVEDAMGHAKFLAFYLLCAVFAAIAHLFVNFDSADPLIGASGAISGIIGAYVVLYPQVRVYMLLKIVVPLPIPIPALWAIGAWILLQLFYAFAPDSQGVAWWAHVGGFAAGALLVALFKRGDIRLFGR
ncbi:MAG: rhomboid family intramembrane serine protease [Cucumibacter sp.]